MNTLSDRLANLLMALQSATSRNDGACLKIIGVEADRIIEEVRVLEQPPKDKERA
jgi:hypothetical protein